MTASPPLVFQRAIRTVAVLATVAAVAFLATRAIVPEGTLVAVTDLSGPAPFVSEPKPSDRVQDPVREGDRTLRPISGTPVYLDVRPPAPFDRVDVSVHYESKGQPLVEIGAMTNAIDGRYDLRGGESRLLDTLIARQGWRHDGNGAPMLYQRPVGAAFGYASVGAFLRSPPPVSQVAAFHADAPLPYHLDGYAPAETMRTDTVSLRGSHRLLTYLKGEALSFAFETQDMNRQSGADPARVDVYRVGDRAPIVSATLADDGDTSDDQRSSGLRELRVSVDAAKLPEGAYQLEFTASDDVFIREIRTPQTKLAFAGRLYLGDHVGYSDRTPPVTVVTDGRRLTARAAHAEATQHLDAAGALLPLDLPGVPVSAALIRRVSGLALVTSPKRDVILETGGTFALSAAEWFDPLPLVIGPETTVADLDAAGIRYVLAGYYPVQVALAATGAAPRVDGGAGSSTGASAASTGASAMDDATVQRTASAAFDLSTLGRTAAGAYRFAISAPGLDDAVGGTGADVVGVAGGSSRDLRIESVTFTLRRVTKTGPRPDPSTLPDPTAALSDESPE